ncbi:hypothetical protein [Paractinoplanes atraurantiacus]|uniref:DUF1508 domain-containing protein n=1 Tax=Paractinoplanes atraurantiacus TaxID=1036182 RepID=A0A285JPD7_9ACTN|nr:hypothetical protein [Actinoplanes atraurantiacus]SNY62182.1 hypothetical protein SAMN05421748_12398 [Actinoplanes atraurantiacus]
MSAARFRVLQLQPGRVYWRLLAINNRDLGRAATAFPDVRSCRAAVVWLQEHAAQLSVLTVRTGPTSWGWRIVADGPAVAVASRQYQRRIQAEQAAAIVLALIPGAEPLADDGVLAI